jgi:hypothetical protein
MGFVVDIGTGFSPSTSVSFHSTCAPLLAKGQKIIIIIVIFITGLHKKPQGVCYGALHHKKNFRIYVPPTPSLPPV